MRPRGYSACLILSGCDVEALDDGRARAAGALADRAATSDIVDACMVEGALPPRPGRKLR